MSVEALVQLVYVSAERALIAPDALRELVQRSRRRNQERDVTGLLLHAEGSFLQVLEGAPAVVDDLFETIANDRRHAHVLRIFRSEVSERSFFDRPLEFSSTDTKRTALLRSVPSGAVVACRSTWGTTGKLRELIAQFHSGKWRQHAPASGTFWVAARLRERRVTSSFARVRA